MEQDDKKRRDEAAAMKTLQNIMSGKWDLGGVS
jgi:hypothetical protein